MAVTTSRPRLLTLAVAAATMSLLLAACGSDEPADTGEATSAASAGAVVGGEEVLLDQQELTVLDQAIAYPKKKPAQISSTIVTVEPGQETGWHRHRVPMYAYVMEGALSVEYDAGVVKDYPTGTAFMEAEDVWHNGSNKGDDPVRILIVYMGAEGKKNAVERSS